MRSIVAITLLTLSVGSAQPTFEVASVKPATVDKGASFVTLPRTSGGPGTADPEQFTTTNTSLKFILFRAFGIKDYQLSGPSWLDKENFDIRAKIAPGTTPEQFRLMLQHLLSERFRMQVHHETREIQAYELVVAKGGPKLRESAQPTGEPITPGANGNIATQKDKDGITELPPGRKGMLRFAMGPGRSRASARMQPISGIVSLCEGQVGHPVIDKTGLTGTYDFNLDYTIGGSGPLPSDGASAAPLDSMPDNGAPFMVAIQSLGVRLLPIKLPVDVVIIDHIERVPTEN
jgi:uncharacterized protein (TIGR03435 family)